MDAFAIQNRFNPLDRGNLNQISKGEPLIRLIKASGFQSPRSGKFESNYADKEYDVFLPDSKGFNPLDRGNLNQIR